MRNHSLFNMMEKCCIQPCCQSMACFACSDLFSIRSMNPKAV